jgi:hypothetical protein
VRESSEEQKKELKKTLDTVGVVRDLALRITGDILGGEGLADLGCPCGNTWAEQIRRRMAEAKWRTSYSGRSGIRIRLVERDGG